MSSHQWPFWAVLAKLRDCPCKRIILIAPEWPNMSWFWDLVAMSSHIPLPAQPAQSADLIIQSNSTQESIDPKSSCQAPRASAIKAVAT